MTDPSEFSGSPLAILENVELSAVTFVRNDLQLQFDGPCLTCYVWPTVSIGSKCIRRGDAAYRNRLCNCIGQKVIAAVDFPDQWIRIHFENDIVLELSWKDPEQRGPEAAMLQDGTGQICVWNS